jgi:hypothetical protein
MDEGKNQTTPIGARKTFWPAAATFARNDLLFTMSDNTHKARAPVVGAHACADSCLRMSRKLILGLVSKRDGVHQA